jgi:hypothetical protein
MHEAQTGDAEHQESAARKLFGPPPAGALAFGGTVPALALAVPVVASALLAGIVVVVFGGRGALAIVNGGFSTVDPGPTWLAVVVAAGVLLVLGNAFGITAATIAMVGAVRSARAPASARDAWRAAVRRTPAVLLAFLVTTVLLLTAVAATVATAVSPWLTIAITLLVFVALVVAAPLLMAWPQIAVGGTAWRTASANAWRTRDVQQSPDVEVFRSPRRALVTTGLVLGVVHVGLAALIGVQSPSVVTAALSAAISFLVPGATVLLLVAIAVRGAAVRSTSAWWTAPGRAPSPSPSTDRLRGGAVLGLAALLVPAVVLVPIVVANPFGITSYSAAQTPQIWRDASVTEVGADTVALSGLGGEGAQVDRCSGAICDPSLEPASILGTAIAGLPDGAMVTAQWRPVEGSGSGSGSDRFELDVVHSSPAQLHRWATGPATHGFSTPNGTRTTVSGMDVAFRSGETVFARSNAMLTAAAVTTSGEHPVVAGIVRGVSGARAQLSITFCDDDLCSSSTTKRIPLDWVPTLSTSGTLGLTVTKGGTAVVSLVDSGRDLELPKLRVISTTADGEPRIETPDSVLGSDDPSTFDVADGAQIGLGTRDRPIVLYRAAGSTTQRVISCDDAACAASGIVDLDLPGAGQQAPAMVVDDTGRPLIAVRNTDRQSIDLVSCLDRRCSTTRTSTIARYVPDERSEDSGGFAMGLTADQTPMIALGDRRVGVGSAHPTWDGTVISCTERRCGVG